ncbi:MAG: hypothetical protein RSC78_03475 [Acidaminococcaceae bacterium]
MREDLVVPGENEEKFIAAHDTRVVTIPFTPLEERMSKEKPYLMEGLGKLRATLGDEKFKRYISTVHNINKSDTTIMLIANSELHRTNIERECLLAIMQAFSVEYVRVVAQG